MNDITLSKNNGKLFTISTKVIGAGAYSTVYKGKNEYGEEVAIKCCQIKEDGIPNILETSILQSLQHPFISIFKI